MPSSFDKIPLEVSCPTCKRKIIKPVNWFKKAGQMCPFGCGASLKTKEFKREIRKAENELIALLGKLKNA